jgi:hypothetical protein
MQVQLEAKQDRAQPNPFLQSAPPIISVSMASTMNFLGNKEHA